MKLEDQVVSLEIAKELKELGVKQDSLWYWYLNKTKGTCYLSDNFIISRPDQVERICSAFTVAELGNIMFDNSLWASYATRFKEKHRKWTGRIGTSVKKRQQVYADTEANARGKMLIYLLKEGLLEGGGE